MPEEDHRPQFTFSPSDPLAAEHEAVSRWADINLKTAEGGRTFLDAKPDKARKIVLAALAQARYWEVGLNEIRDSAKSILDLLNIHQHPAFRQFDVPRRHILKVIEALIRRAIPFERDDIAALLQWCVQTSFLRGVPPEFMVKTLDRYVARNPPDQELKSLCKDYADTLRNTYTFWRTYERRKASALDGLIARWTGDGAQILLVPCEYWSIAVNAHIAALPASVRGNWEALLKLALGATAARPSNRWRGSATELVARIGAQEVRQAFEAWLPLVAKGRSDVGIQDENANALRGFLWMIPLLPRREELARLVSAVALSAYKKIPGFGPRAVKVGNAAVYCLSQMVSPEAMGQLATLKLRIRFGTAQKEVEKAFDAAAVELNLPRDQVEEMSVPSCGLESVGLREEPVGKYRAQLLVTGSDAELRWFDAQGKQLKSIPASAKAENGETVKELQSDLKDVKSMLSAQRERIDSLFLEEKSWSIEVWRERYVNHPLVGTIARRLIWVAQETPITIVDGSAADINGNTVDIPADAFVRLWHPAGRSVDEVIAWRRRIESLGIVQPFKQAHREVYLLTDAERRTSNYSNRFAAHILRQHQFNALCAARRWKNKLRLMVDDIYPPASRELRAWNLRAEFWIEGVGDQFGEDTNDSGVFLRLVTDQVRFYRMGAATSEAHAAGGGYTSRAAGPGADNLNEPLPLEQIPVLAFSEIMRDVDLFVGVASIGNDPTWQDGGPGGHYVEYWQNYSFGELSATAVSRHETLEHLLPRLKIREQCVLADKFLLIKGSRRTYKIHLGSGNVLMEPNNQYLCIVRDAHAQSSNQPVYLPFEGDTTLSIILSKAFLLADDGKIKDETINRQIDRR